MLRVKKLVCQWCYSVYLEAGVKEPVLHREGIALLAKEGEEAFVPVVLLSVYLEAGVK